MNIQIFGSKKCKDSKKTELFFQERRIKFQFINILEKNISKGELTSVSSSIPLSELIDKDSKIYKEKNYQYMTFDIESAILENPGLLKTPVVRDGKRSTVGFKPDIWKKWISES
jgi:arsenate reductase